MKLPFVKPPITSYPNYAELLSAVCSKEHGIKWYYNNYVGLFMSYVLGDQGQLLFRDDMFGFLRLHDIPYYAFHPFINSYNSIDDYGLFFDENQFADRIRTLLNSQYYVVFFMDRFYINENNNGYHDMHSVICYGYDDENFYIADFVPNGKYSLCTVSVENLLKAHLYSGILQFPFSSNKLVVFFRVSDAEYKFDVQLLRSLLTDYLLAKNTLDSYEIQHIRAAPPIIGQEPAYGMAVYGVILQHMEDIKLGVRQLNIRDIYTLKDHKKAMYDRCIFLSEEGYITDTSVIEMSKRNHESLTKCVNLCLKYTVNNDISCLDKVKSILTEVQAVERTVIEQLLAELPAATVN